MGFALLHGPGASPARRLQDPALVDLGVISPRSSLAMGQRLGVIWDELDALLERSSPTLLVLEKAFLGRNVDSVFKLGHARGLALAAAARRQIPVVELAPRAVKRAVTGSGAAEKDQVARVALARVGLAARAEELIANWPSDATDALALALVGFDQMNLGFQTNRESEAER
jgi:crossover junction endodeoxyribonuclease RuvC